MLRKKKCFSNMSIFVEILSSSPVENENLAQIKFCKKYRLLSPIGANQNNAGNWHLHNVEAGSVFFCPVPTHRCFCLPRCWSLMWRKNSTRPRWLVAYTADLDRSLFALSLNECRVPVRKIYLFLQLHPCLFPYPQHFLPGFVYDCFLLSRKNKKFSINTFF